MSDTTATTPGLDSVPAQTGSITTTAPKGSGIADKISIDSTETAEILKRMQAFIEQRESPLAQLMGGLNKAYATTYGPGAALEYQKQQEAEDRQLLDMRSQMGAYRAAQRQADAEAADYAKRMNLGKTQTTNGASPGAGSGLKIASNGTATWDGMEIPESVVSRFKGEKVPGAVGFNKAIVNEWLKGEMDKSTALKYNADMRDMVTVMFEGEPLPMMRSQFEQFAKNNPRILRALKAQNPHLFPGGAGASAESVVPSSGGAAAAASAAPGGAGGAGAPGMPAKTTAAAPGRFDFSGLPTSFKTPNIGGVTGASKEAYEANVKLSGDVQAQAMTSFMKNTYDKLAEKVAVQEDDVMIANDALEAIKTGNYGPGSGINQAVMRAAKALGIKESEADAQQYINNLNISRAKELFKASGARAAMGAQFTAQEAENFGKTLADITDPKEYIKAVYQVKVAMAEINAAKKAYLDAHPNNMPAANAAWEQSGKKKQMLIDKVDYLKERAERQSAMEWLEKNPKDRRAPAIRNQLGLK